MLNKIFYFVILILLISCNKKTYINQNALLHQQSCIKHLESHDLLSAKTNCEICLEYDNSQPECLNALGLIAFLSKDENKALTYFHHAIRQNNNFAQARNNLGVLYFENGNFLKAKNHFTKALKIDPGNLDARYNNILSNIRLFQKEKSSTKKATLKYLYEAQDQANKLIAIEESYDFAFRELGLINLYLAQESEFEDKKEIFLKSSKIAFESCLTYNNTDVCHEGLGQVHKELKNFFLSWQHFFLCLGNNNENAVCKKEIIDSYEKFIKTNKTHQQFSLLIKDINATPMAHEAFCYALFEKGFNQEALTQCQMALRLKPDLCEVKYKLATYFYDQKNITEASNYCKSFLLCENQNNNKSHTCRDIINSKE